MCVGIIKDDLMARVGPHVYEDFLSQPGARMMDFTKRPLKGFLYADSSIWDQHGRLSSWVRQCLIFNKEAKPSAKRK